MTPAMRRIVVRTLPTFTAICVSIDRLAQDAAPIFCYLLIGLGLDVPASRHWLVRTLGRRESSFPVQILACRVTSGSPFTPRIRRQFLQVTQQWERVMRRGPGPGIASCRGAEPQSDQKVNKKLGPHSVRNGLLKHKYCGCSKYHPYPPINFQVPYHSK